MVQDSLFVTLSSSIRNNDTSLPFLSESQSVMLQTVALFVSCSVAFAAKDLTLVDIANLPIAADAVTYLDGM